MFYSRQLPSTDEREEGLYLLFLKLISVSQERESDWSVMLMLASERRSLVTHVASYLWGEREGKNKQNTYHLITEQHITTLQFMKQILSQRELEQAHNISELNGASQTNIS